MHHDLFTSSCRECWTSRMVTNIPNMQSGPVQLCPHAPLQQEGGTPISFSGPDLKTSAESPLQNQTKAKSKKYKFSETIGIVSGGNEQHFCHCVAVLKHFEDFDHSGLSGDPHILLATIPPRGFSEPSAGVCLPQTSEKPFGPESWSILGILGRRRGYWTVRGRYWTIR